MLGAELVILFKEEECTMTKDLSKVPVTIILSNTSEDERTSFRYFRVNFTEVLEPLDEVIITAASSEEAAYYLALNDEAKNLSVVIDA